MHAFPIGADDQTDVGTVFLASGKGVPDCMDSAEVLFARFCLEFLDCPNIFPKGPLAQVNTATRLTAEETVSENMQVAPIG